MVKQKIIIIGASGHAKVVIDIVEKQGKYIIEGLLDDNRKKGEEILGYKILGTIKDLPQFTDHKVIIAIGDNWTRYQIYQKIMSIIPDNNFATAVHPSAQIGKNVTIGIGTVVMAGAIINCDTVIGNFTIINTKASIDHDCRMNNFSSLAPNVTTGGNVMIGEFSAISIGATIVHGMQVGSHSIIGAGALLIENCGDTIIMYGMPAKKVKDRIIGEKYL